MSAWSAPPVGSSGASAGAGPPGCQSARPERSTRAIALSPSVSSSGSASRMRCAASSPCTAAVCAASPVSPRQWTTAYSASVGTARPASWSSTVCTSSVALRTPLASARNSARRVARSASCRAASARMRPRSISSERRRSVTSRRVTTNAPVPSHCTGRARSSTVAGGPPRGTTSISAASPSSSGSPRSAPTSSSSGRPKSRAAAGFPKRTRPSPSTISRPSALNSTSVRRSAACAASVIPSVPSGPARPRRRPLPRPRRGRG